MKRLLLATAALFAAPLHAETVAITGATIATGEEVAPSQGNVVIRDGRVVGIGNVAVPAGARIIDGTGKWVSPGIVAGFTRLGLVGVDAVDETNDASARTSPFSASLDVSTAINPRVPAIAVSRAAGVTRAIVAPEAASAMFAGQGALIDTASRTDIVDKARAFQFVEFGENGARRAGGSRTAAQAWFRNALEQARSFARNPASYDGNSKDALLNRSDAAALVPVIEGRQPLYVHVESGPDILQMLSLKREFRALKLVLVGVSEGWTVAREIAAAGVPVIASPTNDLPASFEALAATQSNVGRLRAAGVEVAIGMIDDDDARQAQLSMQRAGNLVALSKVPGATGLNWGQAFATITSVPARIAGMTDVGTLKPGARDVVMWSGDPLELSTLAERVWIDGVEQPMETRQSRLLKRYLTPQEGAMPKAYDR
ncbi:Amidohydrolase family protein [Sphingomonas antarctica]|uniref:amidohydrolase n=1 Tax=Sphingomonas antarctica TaxID=2040274 RepID=UPI0039E876C2